MTALFHRQRRISRGTASACDIPRAQSTLELALLLPIVCAMLWWIIAGFSAHHTASDHAIQKHAEALVAFNHGNSGAINIDGGPSLPPRGEPPMPDDIPFGDILKPLAKNFVMNLGLGLLFNSVPWLNGPSIQAGYARGYLKSAGSSLANTGKIDTVTAERAGLVGGIESEDFTYGVQHFNPGAYNVEKLPEGFIGPPMATEGFDALEFLGSGVQQGLAEWAATGFDDKAFDTFTMGALSGMLGSDSSQHWFKSEDNEIFKGAVKGALAGSIAGIGAGKMDWNQVATGAAMGAFYTKTVARMLPFTDGLSDPRSSASFGAASAGVTTMLAMGGKATFKDVAFASVGGAFSSRQIQQGIRGSGNFLTQAARGAGGSAIYAAAITSASGGDAKAVTSAIYGSIVPGALGIGYSATVGKAQNAVNSFMQRTIIGPANAIGSNAVSSVRRGLTTPDATEAGVSDEEQMLLDSPVEGSDENRNPNTGEEDPKA
ncbi:MAG: hypothetical protein V1798_05240 [Pseudomonadota bacterium]